MKIKAFIKYATCDVRIFGENRSWTKSLNCGTSLDVIKVNKKTVTVLYVGINEKWTARIPKNEVILVEY